MEILGWVSMDGEHSLLCDVPLLSFERSASRSDGRYSISASVAASCTRPVDDLGRQGASITTEKFCGSNC